MNEDFVREMIANLDKLAIVKLGVNKIYVGSVADSKCSGKSIIIFKNGSLYEG
jgi:hypothetical protein